MNESTLVQACRLLFGDDVVVGKEFLAYLQPAGLKSAYRQRARETHPDSQTRPALPDIEAFFAVQQAYQVVSGYLRQREQRARLAQKAPLARPAQSAQPAARRSKAEDLCTLDTIAPIILDAPRQPLGNPASIDRLYQGPLPERPLLFGHFLYYCGLTTWRTITAVLVQQQRGRPRCGELGTRLGLLQPSDIHYILKRKTANTPFGETAMALGLLNQRQVRALLWQQRQQQKKFGTILVEKELLTLRELSFLLLQFRRHNRLHSSR